MKNAISLILVLVMCLSLCACGASSGKYIGTWECVEDNKYSAYYKLVFYEGGTGEMQLIDEDVKGGIRKLNVSWDIEGNVVNVMLSAFGDVKKYGFKLKGDVLTSVDGLSTFKKVS